MGVRIAAKVRGLSIHHPRSRADRFVTVSFGAASAVPSAALSASDLLQQAEEQVEDAPLERPGFTVI
jgi:PleD family two-component response regulator